MSIRLHRVLGVVCLISAFHASGAGGGDIELKNWSAPMYWGPAVTAPAPDPAAARHGLSGQAPPAPLVSAAPTSPLFFVGIPPCRLADTRPGFGFTGAWGPPALLASTTRDFPITGQCGIPTTAQAVSFNFTVVGPAGGGFLSAYPAGGAFPSVSTLNFVGGQTVANAAVVPLGAGGAVTVVSGVSGSDVLIDVNGYYALSGDRNPAPASPGNPLTIQGGGATAGGTDLRGGDMTMAGGIGTGLGGGGNVHLQTAGANDLSGTTDNGLISRRIIVGKAKQMTLSSPGFTSLMSIHLTGTHTAGGRIFYMVRATDGGSQIATEEGVIQYLATANSITCTVQATDKLHLGTVNSGCTPGFFNPLSQPGVSIFDNVAFSSPAPIVVHEVYFTIENESGASIRLEP
jgi:hypothetical protein